MAVKSNMLFNHLNAELNPIRHLLALIGARHIVHVSRIRVNNDTNVAIQTQKTGKSWKSVQVGKIKNTKEVLEKKRVLHSQ
jgi:hypothetical protein